MECLCTGPTQQHGALTKPAFSTMIHPHLQQCELVLCIAQTVPTTHSQATPLSAASPDLHQMPGLAPHGQRAVLQLVRHLWDHTADSNANDLCKVISCTEHALSYKTRVPQLSC